MHWVSRWIEGGKVIELVVIIVLILAQGVLAGTEVAVVSVRRAQLRELTERSKSAAAAMQQLRADPGPFAATVQMGVTALSTTAGALGAAFLAQRMAGHLGLSIPWLEPYAPALSLVVITSIIALACVVLGDLLPISIALRTSVSYVVWFGRPLLWLSRVCRPLTWLLTAGSDQVMRHLSDDDTQPEPAASPASVLQLLEEARKQGTVHPRAAEIATRAMTFGDLTVADVMVPRNRVHALSCEAKPEDIRRVLLEEGHSCMPVYDGTLDQVVGVLFAKDVLALAWERELIVLQDLIQPPYFAPEIMRAADLLKELQRRRMHFAIAVDELGGTAGIVTVEDLLEELVGEIYGEHDAQTPELIHAEADGSALVQGMVPIRDVNRELRLDLVEGDTWTTVGGLCVSLAGRIPEAGALLDTGDGTTLEVVDASQRRVRLVRVRRPPSGEGPRAAPQALNNGSPLHPGG